ncbi:hypothetical protein CVV43_00705 [Candidatus Saccharibacteria bacterium HGW-Saccharibacteria-1]|jgi:hypothetical protein|nr:MAG: hypothetical protein CVV43_00705 [Candidatus Saccharibacteria bacterium HGW-Saccharibacteria-1]
MFLANILYWWYGGGWLGRVQLLKSRLVASADFFSIDLLASTLFAPYRQISAGSVDGPIGVKVQAFFDKLLSRFIGAIVRSFMVIFGIVAMFLQLLVGLVMLGFWLILPLFPVIGLIMMVLGWVPRWTV